MAYFGVEHWVALSVLGGFGILSILHTLAARFQRERDLHDLRVRAAELRQGYTARVAALRARELGQDEVVEVDVVEEPAIAGKIDAAETAASSDSSLRKAA